MSDLYGDDVHLPPTPWTPEAGPPPQTINVCGNELTLIGWGRHRATYDHKSFVVKVPMNQFGVGDNAKEAETFKLYPNGNCNVKYARCRLMKNGMLVMVKLNTAVPYKHMPDWAWSLDCGQVGFDSKGRILAFDYGC